MHVATYMHAVTYALVLFALSYSSANLTSHVTVNGLQMGSIFVVIAAQCAPYHVRNPLNQFTRGMWRFLKLSHVHMGPDDG